jgi:WD40 repeat protein
MIRDIQCSPDGKYIISMSTDGTASLWDTSTYNKLAVVGSDIYGTAFSSKADVINLCRGNFTSQFNINEMKMIDKNKLISPALSAVQILNDGQTIWNIDQNRYLSPLEKSPSLVRDASFYDSKYLAAYSLKGKVEIWNYQNNTLLQSIPLPENENIQTKFNNDGTQLAVFGDNFSVYLFSGNNFSQKKLLQSGTAKKIKQLTSFELFRMTSPINRSAFAVNGNLLTMNYISDKEVAICCYSPDGNLVYSIPFEAKRESWNYFTTPGITISSNGNVAAIWSYNNYKVTTFNTINGEIFTNIKISDVVKNTLSTNVYTVKFSMDNQSIYIGDWNGDINNWDINGGYLGKFGQDISGILALKYTTNDALTVVTDNMGILRWDITTGRAISQPALYNKFQYPVKIQPDGTVANISNTMTISDINTGNNLDFYLKGWQYNPKYILFDTTPDEMVAVLRDDKNGNSKAVASLNIADGKLLINLVRERDVFPITVNAKTSKALFSGNSKIPAFLVDMKTGFTTPTDIMRVQTAEITDDGEILFADSSVNRINGSNIPAITFGLANANGKIIWKRAVNDIGFAAKIFHSKSYYAICDSVKRKVSIFNFADGSFINKFPCNEMKSVAITPDEVNLITTEGTNTVAVYQLSNGKLVKNFNIMSNPTVTDFSPDGKYVAFGCSNGAVEIISRFNWTRQALAMINNNGDWAVVDDAGRYDASNDNTNGLRWTIANESVALGQLKERYYDPGLLSKSMERNFEPKRDVQALDGVKLFPNMKVDFPTEGTELTVDLTNRGGGIGDLVVLVNGREMPVDARGNNDKNSKSLHTTVNVSHSPVYLPGVDNLIELAVKNADGSLTSRTIARIWRAPGIKKEAQPRLFALICGISEYSGGMKLKFAANDAVSMAKAVKIAGGKFFGHDKVNVITLTSDDINNKPTRVNIMKALDYFKENANTGDLVMVYLSGHGVAINDDNYYYLTSDARSADDVRDKKLRDKYSIGSADLQLLMGRIPALKQMLILDTCAAGSAAKNLIDKRDISGDQLRAIERLRDRSGFHILMGCAADAKSFEASRYGHGLLTYALLEGLKGGALRDNKYIDTSKLFNYAADRVPQLARGVGGVQRPIIAVPHGISFDFGMLDDDDKANIIITTPVPVYIKPTFMDSQKTRDTLNISAILQEKLRNNDEKLIYIDTDSFPDGMKINGIYTNNAGVITAKIKIWQNDKVVKEFTLTGKNVDDVVKQIVGRL